MPCKHGGLRYTAINLGSEAFLALSGRYPYYDELYRNDSARRYGGRLGIGRYSHRWRWRTFQDLCRNSSLLFTLPLSLSSPCLIHTQ